TFRKIPEWAKDKTALLGLARCYQEMGSDAEAISYYTTLRGQFPFSTEGHYAFCCFAVERQLPDARLLLEKALQTWPYFVPLYLLKARHQMHQNDADGALDTLQQASQQFPYSTGAKLALIKYYLMRGQLAKALDAQKQCWALFPGHHKLFSYIEKLIQAKELILAWASDFAEADEKVRRVALPASLLAMFKSLEASGGEHYLTGSSVLSLLTHQPILPAQDLDFVSVEADAYQLKRQGFYPSPYLPNLFAKHRKPNPVSTWLVSTSPIMQPSHAALSRDYTISCLFCDKDGTIYDPTGYGLEDLKHKRLRAIGNPVIRLQEDPARVLRAVKYMALGFKPMPDLDAALRDWKPVHLDQHKPHLDAVLRKHLTSSLLDKKRFIQLLQDYGLLQKILGLKPKASIEQTTALLEHALGIRHKMSDGEYNAARFFAQQPVAARIPTSPKNPRYAEIKEQTDNEKTLEALDLAGFWG
ncbi:tetratricopeptide repeat protein, partial [Legionella londiniensis]